MESQLRYIRYLVDFPLFPMTNRWADTGIATFAEEKLYVVQTYPKVIQRCLLMTTDPGDLVLDPTCGSGTTAYVAEQWGRRWITCDTSRVALALARTRLMSARYPYYLLADSPEGVKKEMEISGAGSFGETTKAAALMTMGDLRKGFVYKRVPHVTLKSIANNPDIKEGMSREEIDRAIAKHADTELLYDQPYEDGKRIRVTGPFTVESLSPHRTISVEHKKAHQEKGFEGWKVKELGPSQFGHIVIENLKKAGVQNTFKNERLKFDRLEPYAGVWLHAAGEYTDSEKKSRRVAVSIGPEHGTVGPELVKEAAKEAVQGVGFDILIVCGFAFDPHVSEEARRYGKLVVLPTRIHADLQMGDEFLKKTGAGNLFMVFGEPDIVISHVDSPSDVIASGAAAKQSHKAAMKSPGKKIVVEIKGLDIYDPTTGEVRSHSTDDIACWFIDTDYNGESFFVRHAYFTGADQPYDKLKRALRAEIDEAAWSALHSTVSRPFDPPKSGKIAVKVINHYGDEVLKVFTV
jgi:adenine-specific DNA-methyltransferase